MLQRGPPRRQGDDRGGAEPPGDRRPRRHARARCTGRVWGRGRRRRAAVAVTDRQADPGRGGSGRRQLRRRDCASACQRVDQPRRRCSGQHLCVIAATLGAAACPLLPRGWPDSSGAGTGPELRAAPSAAGLLGPSGPPAGCRQALDRVRLPGASTERDGGAGVGASVAPRLEQALGTCGARATSPALPPSDLASSPLAAAAAPTGAFRADVSGAGPPVYGLFHHRRPRRGGAARAAGCGQDLADGSRLVRMKRDPPRSGCVVDRPLTIQHRPEPLRSQPAREAPPHRAARRSRRGHPRPGRRDRAWWSVVLVAILAVPCSTSPPAGRPARLELRELSWIFAVSQLAVVLVPALAGVLIAATRLSRSSSSRSSRLSSCFATAGRMLPPRTMGRGQAVRQRVLVPRSQVRTLAPQFCVL